MIEISNSIDIDGDGYEVALSVFEGPLDLLLSLIEQEELDITKIALAQVTDQYLGHLEELKETDPNDLTDFLVIAAKLILIKSEVLLPRPPPILAEDDEEDVGDELARQLLLYKRFKEIAAHLRELEDSGDRNFVRVVPRVTVEPKFNPGEGNLEALLEAARRAFTIKPEEPDVDEVVSRQIVTIGQQMEQILHALASKQRITFDHLLGQTENKIEIIVTLLAILELIKRRIIKVEQPNHFGDLVITQTVEIQTLSKEEYEELLALTNIS